jgi:hypothetical protein
MATPVDLPQRATEKALDVAVESWKQQITFGGVLLALSLTLSKDVTPPQRDVAALVLTVAGWVALLVSIVTGLLAFGRLTARLTTRGQVVDHDVIWTSRQFALAQFLFLVVGVVLLGGAVARQLTR